jgi:hypothetical protein
MLHKIFIKPKKLLLLALNPPDQPAITRFAILELGKVEGMRTQHTHTSAALAAAARLNMSGNELPFALHLAEYIYTSHYQLPNTKVH